MTWTPGSLIVTTICGENSGGYFIDSFPSPPRLVFFILFDPLPLAASFVITKKKEWAYLLTFFVTYFRGTEAQLSDGSWKFLLHQFPQAKCVAVVPWFCLPPFLLQQKWNCLCWSGSKHGHRGTEASPRRHHRAAHVLQFPSTRQTSRTCANHAHPIDRRSSMSTMTAQRRHSGNTAARRRQSTVAPTLTIERAPQWVGPTTKVVRRCPPLCATF